MSENFKSRYKQLFTDWQLGGLGLILIAIGVYERGAVGLIIWTFSVLTFPAIAAILDYRLNNKKKGSTNHDQ